MSREKPETVACRLTKETKNRFRQKLQELGTTQQEFLEQKIKEAIEKE